MQCIFSYSTHIPPQTNMTIFTGQFFSVTKYSKFRITVRDSKTSPQVMKMRIREPGKDLVVPVGGILIILSPYQEIFLTHLYLSSHCHRNRS